MANLCADCNKPTKKETHARCDACKQKKSRMKKKATQTEPIFCLHCKKQMGYKYKLLKTTRKYCSGACRVASFREREKQKEIKRVEAERGEQTMKWELITENHGLQQKIIKKHDEIKELRMRDKSNSFYIGEILKRESDKDLEIKIFIMIIVGIIFVGGIVEITWILGLAPDFWRVF